MKCRSCSGEFIGPQRLPPTPGKVNGVPVLWCEDCIEEARRAYWDEETDGPFEPRITLPMPRPRWPFQHN